MNHNHQFSSHYIACLKKYRNINWQGGGVAYSRNHNICKTLPDQKMADILKFPKEINRFRLNNIWGIGHLTDETEQRRQVRIWKGIKKTNVICFILFTHYKTSVKTVNKHWLINKWYNKIHITYYLRIR